MRLACKKCHTILTNDLYQVKDFVRDPVVVDDIPNESSEEYINFPAYNGDTEPSPRYSIKKGTFALLKHANPHVLQFEKNKKNVNNMIVSPEDIIDQSQLAFVSGWGCCGNSYMDFKCPSCSAFLGYQHLDCYEDKHVRFYDKEVTRRYS